MKATCLSVGPHSVPSGSMEPHPDVMHIWVRKRVVNNTERCSVPHPTQKSVWSICTCRDAFTRLDGISQGGRRYRASYVYSWTMEKHRTQTHSITMCESGDDLFSWELLFRAWKTGRGNPVVEFNLDNSCFHVSRNTGPTPGFWLKIGNFSWIWWVNGHAKGCPLGSTCPSTFKSPVSQSVSMSLYPGFKKASSTCNVSPQVIIDFRFNQSDVKMSSLLPKVNQFDMKCHRCWQKKINRTSNIIIAAKKKINPTSKVCSQPSSFVSSNSPRTTFQAWRVQRVNIALTLKESYSLRKTLFNFR